MKGYTYHWSSGFYPVLQKYLESGTAWSIIPLSILKLPQPDGWESIHQD
jgi:hypothetical protein